MTEQEFTSFYRENYEDLLRFVRRRAQPQAVDDIVGDTFLVAWRRRADLPAEARPWLFRTARNSMLNAHRGFNRQTALAVRIGARAVPDHGIGPEISLDDRIDLQTAWRALAASDQEILALTVWDELPQSEAAAVIGCSRAAYSMRLNRAKRRLADLLGVTSPSLAILSR